jgi:hypothetical protein
MGERRHCKKIMELKRNIKNRYSYKERRIKKETKVGTYNIHSNFSNHRNSNLLWLPSRYVTEKLVILLKKDKRNN